MPVDFNSLVKTTRLSKVSNRFEVSVNSQENLVNSDECFILDFPEIEFEDYLPVDQEDSIEIVDTGARHDAHTRLNSIEQELGVSCTIPNLNYDEIEYFLKYNASAILSLIAQIVAEYIIKKSKIQTGEASNVDIINELMDLQDIQFARSISHELYQIDSNCKIYQDSIPESFIINFIEKRLKSTSSKLTLLNFLKVNLLSNLYDISVKFLTDEYSDEDFKEAVRNLIVSRKDSLE